MAELKPSIYIVDDEPLQRDMLKDHLGKMSGYDVHAFATGEECVAALKVRPAAIVFLDFYLNSQVKEAMNGIDILKEIKEMSPKTEVVMISGQDKIEVAVNTMKYGAFDYIVKGEGAFYRAEKAVFNIYRFNKMAGTASRYKRLTVLFGIGMLLMILLVLYLQQSGFIKSNPGWM